MIAFAFGFEPVMEPEYPARPLLLPSLRPHPKPSSSPSIFSSQRLLFAQFLFNSISPRTARVCDMKQSQLRCRNPGQKLDLHAPQTSAVASRKSPKQRAKALPKKQREAGIRNTDIKKYGGKVGAKWRRGEKSRTSTQMGTTLYLSNPRPCNVGSRPDRPCGRLA